MLIHPRTDTRPKSSARLEGVTEGLDGETSLSSDEGFKTTRVPGVQTMQRYPTKEPGGRSRSRTDALLRKFRMPSLLKSRAKSSQSLSNNVSTDGRCPVSRSCSAPRSASLSKSAADWNSLSLASQTAFGVVNSTMSLRSAPDVAESTDNVSCAVFNVFRYFVIVIFF